tara:strand:+ start:40 stop:1062 length:1023 start_codon:yes stop_codon:yes gene_type:complete
VTKERKTVKRVLFEDKTVDYVNLHEGESLKKGEKHLTGQTNPETWSLMKDKFVVLRNFIPKEISNMALDSWKTIESQPKMDEAILNREHEITQGSPKDSLGKSKAGYCTPMGVALHRWLGENLTGIIDMDLRETYSYTRKYDRGAYLRAHTDRPSCEISATVCLDYHCDDGKPWSIWVQNDENYIDIDNMDKAYEISQGLPHRKRRGIKIDLEVGDVLLYQGPNVIHWRDYLLGDYSYHIFMHFINHNSRMYDIKDWFHIDPKVMGNQLRHSVLEHDGRFNRYTYEDWESPHKKRMGEFNRNYNGLEKGTKYRFVNAYDNLVLPKEAKELKQKKKENDSI